MSGIGAYGLFLRTIVVLLFAASAAQVPAQHYPTRPVRVVVPYPPGGANDTVMRVLAPKVSQELGQQLVIDNRAGGNTIIGSEWVEKAAGVEATDVGVEQFDQLMRAELLKWEQIVKPLNIAAE